MTKLLLIISIFALVACQTGPTRVYEKSAIRTDVLQARAKNPIRITEDTVIVDARKAFDFAIAHIPGSVNLNWSDFTERDGPFQGHVSKDIDRHARRLATYGISPSSPVIVVGDGKEGSGEEGRLAWTLLYLGAPDVQIADVDALKLRFSNEVPPPRENAATWEPDVRESIVADRREVLDAIAKKSKTFILDVRTKNEYFSKTPNLQYELPDLGAIHMPWTEFLTDEGRPNLRMRGQLRGIGIGPDDRIIVISNRGIRSAAVTFVLVSLGFKNAANFAGGYRELMSKRSR